MPAAGPGAAANYAADLAQFAADIGATLTARKNSKREEPFGTAFAHVEAAVDELSAAVAVLVSERANRTVNRKDTQ